VFWYQLLVAETYEELHRARVTFNRRLGPTVLDGSSNAGPRTRGQVRKGVVVRKEVLG
jgi:hypothetical protein